MKPKPTSNERPALPSTTSSTTIKSFSTFRAIDTTSPSSAPPTTKFVDASTLKMREDTTTLPTSDKPLTLEDILGTTTLKMVDSQISQDTFLKNVIEKEGQDVSTKSEGNAMNTNNDAKGQSVFVKSDVSVEIFESITNDSERNNELQIGSNDADHSNQNIFPTDVIHF